MAGSVSMRREVFSLGPSDIVVFGPDSEEPTIGSVAQKWRRRIFFVVAEPLLRSET